MLWGPYWAAMLHATGPEPAWAWIKVNPRFKDILQLKFYRFSGDVYKFVQVIIKRIDKILKLVSEKYLWFLIESFLIVDSKYMYK